MSRSLLLALPLLVGCSGGHYASYAMVAVGDDIRCDELDTCFGPITWQQWTEDPADGAAPMDPPMSLDMEDWPAGKPAFFKTVAETGHVQEAHWMVAFMDNDRNGEPTPGDIESTPPLVELNVTKCTMQDHAIVDCNALPDWVILDHVIED